MRSESMTAAPSDSRTRATDDFPAPIPPVKPMIGLMRLARTGNDVFEPQLAPGLARIALRGALDKVRPKRHRPPPRFVPRLAATVGRRDQAGSVQAEAPRPTSPPMATRPGTIWPRGACQTGSQTEHIRRRGRLQPAVQDRKSTRLNSSHSQIS